MTITLGADPRRVSPRRDETAPPYGGAARRKFCAYDDTVALAVLAGPRRHGLTAPQDLAVVGVNDLAGPVDSPIPS